MSRYKFELLVFKLAMRPSMKEDRFEKSKESHAAGVCDPTEAKLGLKQK